MLDEDAQGVAALRAVVQRREAQRAVRAARLDQPLNPGRVSVLEHQYLAGDRPRAPAQLVGATAKPVPIPWQIGSRVDIDVCAQNRMGGVEGCARAHLAMRDAVLALDAWAQRWEQKLGREVNPVVFRSERTAGQFAHWAVIAFPGFRLDNPPGG